MIKDKVLYIDCQILQTAAFDRGMGKYVVSLINALASDSKDASMSIELILSKNLDVSESRLGAIRTLTGCDKINYLDLPSSIAVDHKKKIVEAKRVLSDFLQAQNGSQLAYLMTAPFFVDFPSVFPEGDDIDKYSIVYDITPQKIEHIQKIFPDDIYYQHYRVFFDADHLLTISESVKKDLEAYIGIDPTNVTSMAGGPFEVSNSEPERMKNTYVEPYIHFPTGSMIHKNNERAIRAFDDFNKNHEEKYRLYITSTFSDEEKERLSQLSSHIVFTGNISDEEMHYAFKNAAVVLFASLAEGLGMPVLEANQYDTVVACSDIPVLSEISKDAFFLFDPLDIASISSALTSATNEGLSDKNRRKASEEVKLQYTWKHTAKIALSVMSAKTTPHTPSAKIVLTSSKGKEAKWLLEQLYGCFASMVGSNRVSIEPTLLQSMPRLKHYAHSMQNTDTVAEQVMNIEIEDVGRLSSMLFGRDSRLRVVINKEIILEVAVKKIVIDHALQNTSYVINHEGSNGLASVLEVANTLKRRISLI